MTGQLKTSITDRLTRAEAIITDSLNNPEIMDAMVHHGYNASAVLTGKELCEKARKAVEVRKVARGVALRSTRQAHTARQLARASYQKLAQTVRAIYPPTSPEYAMLGLTGPMPARNSAFISAAIILFDNTITVQSIGAAVLEHGYDAQRLVAGRQIILNYQQAVHAQRQAASSAKHATREQSEAIDNMQRWLSKYLKVAAVALRDEPELLDVLGISHRRSTQAAQQALAEA